MASCGICRLTIDRTKDIKIKCCDCSQIVHSNCVNLTATDLEYMKDKKQPWFCQICVKKRRNNKLDEPLNNPQQRPQPALIGSQPPSILLNEIESLKQEFLNQFAALKERFTTLEDNLSKQLKCLSKVNEDLRNENLQLQIRLSNVEQYQHNKSIDIIGLPRINDNELLSSVLTMFTVCLNLNISENDIDSIHTVKPPPSSNKPRNIIHVKFVRKCIKDSVFRAKKGSKNLTTTLLDSSPGNLIYINHSMCAAKRKIFNEAWKLKKAKKCYHVWYNNGRVYMKMDEHGDVLTINTLSDLEHF